MLGNIVVVNRHDTAWRYSLGMDIQPIYIGRGTIWGNQASDKMYIGVNVLVGSREEAVTWYRGWLRKQYVNPKTAQYQGLRELAWRYLNGDSIVLMCSCKPKACHGDVLMEAIKGVARQISLEE